MQSCAYHKMYLDDAQANLGNCFDYAIRDCGFSPKETTDIFISSGIADLFGKGMPKYVTGMSGTELFRHCLSELGRDSEGTCEHSMRWEKTQEYWAGWISAYYQWLRGISFRQLFQTLPLEAILDRYLLHEAPVEKSVDVFDWFLRENRKI